ncbi:hypothetical protein FA15DRAFT_681687 [Coprinopsis marcescibilis]|uniref:stearoyl-CoA 9-desaturase n=1 Tax=Coprinopsis marcescibilis TaxID=230819 RepID=A0A5C3KQ91_COPMA|nr:hypothetical protein FA15DRAFT_681687 [Coprinopsis marcescibilis]
MGKGTKGKSSATSGTRKKHAKKQLEPDTLQPQKKVKKDRGKKKDKEPRKKVYIPPIKPAPVQPDPLETTGLARSLPSDLLVVLRSFSKKAQVTKIKALEELNSGWVEKALNEGEDGTLSYVLVEMLPVWMHHISALFIHPSRRVRFLTASLHLSFLRIPIVREQLFFFLRETADASQVERIVGSWRMAANDVDKSVALSASKSWNDAFGSNSSQIQLDEALRLSLFEFIEQTSLDPEGVYAQLNPVQPSVAPPSSQPQSRKGSGRSTPVKPVKREDQDMIMRSKMEDAEESEQDKKARLRIGALGAINWYIQNVPTLPDSVLSLFSNPVFLTCLSCSQTSSWISDVESFGYGQPPVRKAMWTLIQTLLSRQKGNFQSSVPPLSAAILRSAWVEADINVKSAMWLPLLTFVRDFPSSWEIEYKVPQEDEENEDSDDDDEEEEEERPEQRAPEAAPTGPRVSPAYEDFLEFLRSGCSGSPIQGYPIVVIALSTVPASTLFFSSDTPLENLFAAFWAALDSRALSSLNRATATAAFLSSLLESVVLIVRRLRAYSPPAGEGDGAETKSIDDKTIISAQITTIWQEIVDGRLKVEEATFAKELGNALDQFKKVDSGLYEAAWDSIRSSIASASKTHPTLVATFIKALSEDGKELVPEGAQDSMLGDLFSDALAAYTLDEAPSANKQLLPDLLDRYKGDLLKNPIFSDQLKDMLEEKADGVLEVNPGLVFSILEYWGDEERTSAVWQKTLAYILSGHESVLPLVFAAISRLPGHLKPASEAFDAFVSQLYARAAASPTLEKPAFASLTGVLRNHGYFMTNAGFLSLFASIVVSLKHQIEQIFEGGDPVPVAGMTVLVGLVVETFVVSQDVLVGVEELVGVMLFVFLYGWLLPLCDGAVDDDEESVRLSKELWKVWSGAKGTSEGHRSGVIREVKERLSEFVVNTKCPRVGPPAVLELLSERLPEFDAYSVLDFLPSEDLLDQMAEGMSSREIDPSMGVVDPQLRPAAAKPLQSSAPLNDRYGYSSYARGVYALLQALSGDRTLAKRNVWALRHLMMLSVYAQDFQSVPGKGCPAFDERVLGVGLNGVGGGMAGLGEVIGKIDQMVTYLLLSGEGEDWRKFVVESLLAEKESVRCEMNALSHFVVGVVGVAKRSEGTRDVRVLRAVLEHVLEDAGVEDADSWVQVGRKLERTAPETSMAIIYAVTQAGLECQKLDRYRNEVAASLLGIKPDRVNTEGLLALRRLTAAAPDSESDVIFLPQLRAVNVVKACQKWVEGAGGEDEGDDEDEDEGVDEDVENAMLPVFAILAPILQNDHGKHWDFVFDVVETVLENSSISDDATLVGLSRALKMVNVIEELCKLNRALRAEWEGRRSKILTAVRDLAMARIEPNAGVSVPRSMCRGLLLSIAQTLPASLIDHETLGKMCHLITDPSTEVQKMAYQLLKTAAERRTEYLVIEVGVGNIGGEKEEEEQVEPELVEEKPTKGKKKKQKESEKKDDQPALLPAELVNILQRDVMFVPGTGEDEEEYEQNVFGWMLAWLLLFDSFRNASFKVKSMYIEQLRNHDLVGSRLLPTIVNILHLGEGPGKVFKVQIWGVDEFYVEYYEASMESSIPVLAGHLYYRALLCVPSLVHSWVLDCKDRQLNNAITSMTSQSFSPLIIQAELAHVRSPEGVAELTGDGLTVKVVGGGSSGAGGNEVVASYSVDEHQLELRLKIPVDWPLHRIEVKDEKRVGVDENRWRAWVLGVQQTIWTHNGRIVDGLSLFKKNVTLHFEGQVECAICYSQTSVTTFSTFFPTLTSLSLSRLPATVVVAVVLNDIVVVVNMAATKHTDDHLVPADANIPDNYVQHTLKTTKELPPFQWSNSLNDLNFLNCFILLITPFIGLAGAMTTPLQRKTFFFSVAYYYFTGLGITAGYHRLWAHRSYNASKPLQYFLAFAGAGAVEGSIKWWSRGHRAHHRYTDTDLDPYNAHKGFFYSHLGWMLLKPRRKPGVADVSDLSKNPVVRWQHKYYIMLILIAAIFIPTFIPYYFWNDARGGFVYAALLRLTFVHHSTFCVNSLAHWLGETPFDDKHTPRDHMITALATIGEGYHNFHHQFPMDYRNAIKWYQYDPTKWFIWTMQKCGLASHLKVFPDNEVRKGQLTMELKKLRQTQEKLAWPMDSNDLPVISWESFQEQSKKRHLVLISGFIHDVGTFIEEHPGGAHLIIKFIGKDATTAFFGGVYDHSNAAHNLLAMKRVGVLHGGAPSGFDEKMIPPSQRLKIARYNEIGSSPYSSTAAYSDGEGILG